MKLWARVRCLVFLSHGVVTVRNSVKYCALSVCGIIIEERFSHCRHLANSSEQAVRGGDAAL